MTVQQVIDLARGRELRQLAVKDDITTLLGYYNMGVIELYKRFPLKVEEVIIELLDDQYIYTLPADFMWIVAAYGETTPSDSSSVNILPINEEDEPDSINTVGWNKVQIPLSIAGARVSIIYVSSPEYLTEKNLTDIAEFPVQLLEALVHYIGFCGHVSQNGDAQKENNVHYQRFVASCELVRTMGMYNTDDVSMNKRIETRGFE